PAPRQTPAPPPPDPAEPVRLDCLGEPWLRDQDVVATGRHAFQPFAPDRTELSLDPVPGDRVAGPLRHGEAQARLAAVLLAREPVENEEPGRRRASLTIEGVEG